MHRPLLVALGLSLLLHAVALVIMPVPAGQAVAANEAPIEVALVRLPPAAEPAPAAAVRPQQMVAPSDESNDRAPEHPRFESDRDNEVAHETVRPGVPNPGPAAPPQHAPAAAAETAPGRRAPVERAPQPAAGEATRQAPPALHDLFASTDELVRAEERARREREPQDGAPGDSRHRLALAVPPVAPDWTLPGTRGTFDYLPDIQRGDVTLLNTKASVFAPFVRRVGERVFQHLIIRQRRLELQQILNARAPVQMRVVLDARGKLKTVRTENHSGSATMDETLSDALASAAFDNNPPPEAANADCEYEFVFEALLRTFAPGEGGRPNRIESRLSVGLL